MVLPIGFFMPLPLAMMIPFMGIQSAVMAKQFGENFQYGKRRISAMSNEEFNQLTPAKLQAHANEELKAMIPSMEASVREMRMFQTFLIREFLATLNDAIGAGLGKLFGFDETGIFGGNEQTPPTAPTSPPVTTPPRGTPKQPIISNVKTLQNFSDTPTAFQKTILALMNLMSSRNKLHIITGASKAVKQSNFRAAKSLAAKWKTQYKLIKGYKNPLPVDAMPWLHPDFKALLRGWENEV